jgi:hypothetical protein
MKYIPFFRINLLLALSWALLPLIIQPVLRAQERDIQSDGITLYFEWTQHCIDGIWQEVPAMQASADAAARRYIEADRAEICALGDPGFVGELQGRSGGLIQLKTRAPAALNQAIVLYALREDRVDADAEATAKLHDAGSLVVVFGRETLIESVRERGGKWQYALNNHALPEGGLLKSADNENYLIPTDPVANAILGWSWVAEFAAACSRLGKFPVFYEGYAVPGGQAWADKLRQSKFHADAPYAVPPGRLARDFLRDLRKDIDALYFREADAMRELARRVVENRKAGLGVYAFLHGHSVMVREDYPGNPGYFTRLNRSWFDQYSHITLQPGDLVFCLGFDQLYQGWQFKTWAADARASGAVLVWSITDYNENPESGAWMIPEDELWINQRWSFGDAVVNVPGYPINICPTSGVIAEFILWSVQAQVALLLGQVQR